MSINFRGITTIYDHDLAVQGVKNNKNRGGPIFIIDAALKVSISLL